MKVVAICSALSLIAMVFSWITMATGDWAWYIPTVLLAVASFGFSLPEFSHG